MHEKISIIIPVYKVEPFLKRCVDSVTNQTYKNIEIILVDDGSPDHCPAICDEYARNDNRIRVIHQSNGGLSAARNAGIEAASGIYVGFVDSDDYIDGRMYEILYGNLKKAAADISVCNFAPVFDNALLEQSANVKMEIKHVYDKLQALRNLYDNDKSIQTVVAWNKLYKKEIFKKIRYPVGKLHEDEFVIHHILDAVSTVVYSDVVLYYYRQRSDSIMGQLYSANHLDALQALAERMSFFQKQYKDLYPYAFVNYMNGLIIHYQLAKKSPLFEYKIRKMIKNNFDSCYFSNLLKLSLKQKTRYFLFWANPSIFILINKIWNQCKRIK